MAKNSNRPGRLFRLGLLGFGTVGSGAARIILDSTPPLKDKTGIDLRLHKIAVRDRGKPRAVALDPKLFTTDCEEVVNDPEVDIVVEVMGGLEPARSLLLKALQNGKAVVTANKAVLATHGKELFEAALAHQTSIGFEASVCGGMPVVGASRDGLVANRVESIHGILNGTTNDILTRMVEDQAPYARCLYEAQSKGYAEADPSTDVKGIDAAHKLVLLGDLELLDDGGAPTAFGVMGGDVQPQGHLAFVANTVDLRANPQEALDRPRFRYESGAEVVVETPEAGVDEGGQLGESLSARGHEVVDPGAFMGDRFGGGGPTQSAGSRSRNRPMNDIINDVLAAAQAHLKAGLDERV